MSIGAASDAATPADPGYRPPPTAAAYLPAQTFPIVIAEWPRNGRENVRIALDRYNNRFTIDVRLWWKDSEGNWRPSRDGLTLAVRHLPTWVDGLADALDRARVFGLIEPTKNSKDRTGAARQRRYR